MNAIAIAGPDPDEPDHGPGEELSRRDRLVRELRGTFLVTAVTVFLVFVVLAAPSLSR